MKLDITFPGGKRVDAHTDGVTIMTDQSVAHGGEGAAPEPFTLFLASLGACAGVFALGFCQSRNIDTQGLRLTQEVEFDEATHRMTKVRLLLQTPPGFPEKYVSALQNTVNRCTVKRAMMDPPAFETVVEQAPAADGLSNPAAAAPH